MQPRSRASRQAAAAAAAAPQGEEAIQREWNAQRDLHQQNRLVGRIREKDTEVKQMEAAANLMPEGSDERGDLLRQAVQLRLEVEKEAARHPEVKAMLQAQSAAPQGKGTRNQAEGGGGSGKGNIPPPAAFNLGSIASGPAASEGPGGRAGLFGPVAGTGGPAVDSRLFGLPGAAPNPSIGSSGTLGGGGSSPAPPWMNVQAGLAEPSVAAGPTTPNGVRSREAQLQLRRGEFMRNRQQQQQQEQAQRFPQRAAEPSQFSSLDATPKADEPARLDGCHADLNQAVRFPQESVGLFDAGVMHSPPPRLGGRFQLDSLGGLPGQGGQCVSSPTNLGALCAANPGIDGIPTGLGGPRPCNAPLGGMPVSSCGNPPQVNPGFDGMPFGFGGPRPCGLPGALNAPAGGCGNPPQAFVGAQGIVGQSSIFGSPPQDSGGVVAGVPQIGSQVTGCSQGVYASQPNHPGQGSAHAEPPAHGVVPGMAPPLNLDGAAVAKRAYGEELRRQAEADRLKKQGLRNEAAHIPSQMQQMPHLQPVQQIPSQMQPMQNLQQPYQQPLPIPAAQVEPAHQNVDGGGLFSGLGAAQNKQEQIKRQQKEEYRLFLQQQQEQQQQQKQQEHMQRMMNPLAQPGQAPQQLPSQPQQYVQQAAFQQPQAMSAAPGQDALLDRRGQRPAGGLGVLGGMPGTSNAQDDRRKQQDEMKRVLAEQVAEKERQKKLAEQKRKEEENRENERIRRDQESEKTRLESERVRQQEKQKAVQGANSQSEHDHRFVAFNDNETPSGPGMMFTEKGGPEASPAAGGFPSSVISTGPPVLARPDLFGAPPGSNLFGAPSGPCPFAPGGEPAPAFSGPAVSAPPWDNPRSQSTEPYPGQSDGGHNAAGVGNDVLHGLMKQQHEMYKQQQEALSKLQDEADRLRQEKDHARQDLLDLKAKQVEEKEREVKKLQKKLQRQMFLQGDHGNPLDSLDLDGWMQSASTSCVQTQGGWFHDSAGAPLPPGAFYSKYEDEQLAGPCHASPQNPHFAPSYDVC
eukprot:TRINITY_DN3418_c1_g2_i5.p1 TRINITY_DN3418_c1_g2~~TRINITY_DN3418_c1_g2_i5.p1  ORF type:complete len:1022 (+),score=235.96 TRINITY_DN3418_c1_g2_i5:266-3331(+)